MYSLGEDPAAAPWPPVQPPTEGVIAFAVQKLQEKIGAPVTGVYDDVTHAALVAWAKNSPSVPAVMQANAEKWVSPAGLPWLIPAGLALNYVMYSNIAWSNWKKSKKGWFGKYWWAVLMAGGAVAGVVAWKKSRRS